MWEEVGWTTPLHCAVWAEDSVMQAGLEAGPPGTFLEAQGAGARAGGLCGGMPEGGFPETGHSSWERFPARPAPPGPGHSRQMGGAGRHCQGGARPQTAHACTGATGGPVRTHLRAWAMPGANSAPRVQTWAAREPQKASRIHADLQAPADRDICLICSLRRSST